MYVTVCVTQRCHRDVSHIVNNLNNEQRQQQQQVQQGQQVNRD